MKRLIILTIFMIITELTIFAQKDINAWKNEKNLELQYEVFQKNLNYWDGKYFMNEQQLSDYYRAFSDSVAVLEKENLDKIASIKELQDQLTSINSQLEDTKEKLDYSIQNRNSIEVLGLKIDKGFFTLIISVIIITLLALLVILFLMYKRSMKVTLRTKKDYADLKEEFEVHKKESLDRYTKINMELHHTRLQLLNKR